MSVPDLDSYMEDDDHPADSEAGPNVHVGAALFAQHMIGYLNEEELSADEEIERSEGARTPDDQHDNDNISRKRSRSETRSNKTSTEWYPWPDKIACTIDILMNLPRSVFSQRQLDIFLWVLAANGIADTPSASSMQRLQTLLQTMCGIRTLQYKGALGHNYFVNSLADIIAQEMANPRVRPHLQFYPEDNGKSVNEYWQASHWREEADPSKLTPLAIIGSQHFFVFEPCLLRDGRPHIAEISTIMASKAAAHQHVEDDSDIPNLPGRDDDDGGDIDGHDVQPSRDSDAGSIAESASSAGSPRAKAKKTKKESMSEMLDRVKRFVKIGPLRRKDDSIKDLKSMFTLASSVGNVTKIKELKTQAGLKDKFLDSFTDRMYASYVKVSGHARKKAALNTYIATLPEVDKMLSPVWRIKGLDPHTDTPVEVLHVVLLGFVKYFWRDAIQIQLKNNDTLKELLITRLNSLNTSGLPGLAKTLAGRTLVQYSGSLTGRDFRIIAQVAPFVLYDLVSPKCYDAWLSLSALVPLIWQPEIRDIDAHLCKLSTAIKHFLAATARWSPRWFNKPKFHILLHLVEHIRRFGPASLFATEAFESFNAVIRAKSVHSNRQSPSRDIAIAFAHGNRIRHLLSGGFTKISRPDAPAPGSRQARDSTSSQNPTNQNAENWRRAGSLALQLVETPSIVTDYLGMDKKDYSRWGPAGAPLVGFVREILQQIGTQNYSQSRPDAILIQACRFTGAVDPYMMPGVVLSQDYAFVGLEVPVVVPQVAAVAVAVRLRRVVLVPLVEVLVVAVEVQDMSNMTVIENSINNKATTTPYMQQVRVTVSSDTTTMQGNMKVRVVRFKASLLQSLQQMTPEDPVFNFSIPPQDSAQVSFLTGPDLDSPPVSPLHRSSNFVEAAPGSRSASLLFANNETMQLIVDAMANDFSFGDAANEFREGMHVFAQLGDGLSVPDLTTRLQLLGTLNLLVVGQRQTLQMLRTLNDQMVELRAQADENFAVTGDQKTNVRIIAGDLLFDPNRIAFMELHQDVDIELQHHYKTLFKNVYGNPIRERALLTCVKKQCSEQRNRFREILISSVVEPETLPLNEVLLITVGAFKRGGQITDTLCASVTGRLAILRRFICENMSKLVDLAPEVQTEDTTTTSSGAGTTDANGSSLTTTPAAETGGTRAGKRRKVSPASSSRGGRPKTGTCFWSQVELFFIAQCKRPNFGCDWNSTGWSAYTAEALRMDRERFKPVEVHNPYMQASEVNPQAQPGPSRVPEVAQGMRNALAIIQQGPSSSQPYD
ncbi:hypothetical protein EUX98_g5331 [Antrodiella citrinella]|uniref:Uncharacterized protein n=1 Tax=Antrodiella citrinella TaxID=2447956 RepID=A0A4V6S1U2_9APHY|nr:hypothetical protein EUX98_g5331 [Antrodiella citrinella]